MSVDPEPAVEVRPTVSVIMVCYNGSGLLPESLASLEAQSFSDWELVFWDNGSTDGSADLARSFDTRTRVLGGAERLTLGAARGKAVEAARGSRITFLDHDDLWRSDKLERQVATMADSSFGLCYSDCRVIDHSGADIGRYARRVRPHQGRVRRQLFFENFIPTVTVMISREAYDRAGAFDPSLNMPADYEEWLRIARESEVAFDSEPLGAYRLCHGSLTSDLDVAYRQVEALFDRLGRAGQGSSEARWISRGRAAHYWRWALRGASEGAGLGESVSHFWAGCLASGGLVHALSDLRHFGASLLGGIGVRRAMMRSRRQR